MAEKEFKYDIIKELATLAEPDKGYDTVVNVISWNGGKPKIDIRKWSKDREKMAKGISLSIDECYVLKELLNNINLSKFENATAPVDDELADEMEM